jgi:hypothetical protein
MRIRTIKPEFWRSDDVTALPFDLRLLFIGLWSYVDDNGVGVDDYRRIAADLFALEEDQVAIREFIRDGLATLSRRSLIVRYKINGTLLVYIPSWDEHQRVDKPGKPRYPRPPGDFDPLTSQNGANPDHVETHSRDRRETVAPGTGEQGNRGTGEQGKNPAGLPSEGESRPRARGNGGQAGRTEHPSAADLNSTAVRPDAYRLVGEWSRSTGGVTSSQRRRLGKAADELLAQGAEPGLIAEALDEAHRPEWRDPVRSLPSAYDRVRRRRYPPPVVAEPVTPRPSTTDRARAEVRAAFDQALGRSSKEGA